MLVRTRRTPPQRGSGRSQRLANVAGAFAALPGPPRRLLLVDDVRTTGATLSEAAHVLEAAGHDVVPLAIVAVNRHA